MAPNSKLLRDEKTIQDIREMVDFNMTQNQIAEYYDVSQNTINRICKEFNIVSNLRRNSGSIPIIIPKNKLLDVYNNTDMSIKEKSKFLGISHCTLYDNLAYYNIQLLKNRTNEYYFKNTPPKTDDEIKTILKNNIGTCAKKCSMLNVKLPTLYSLYDKYFLKKPVQLEIVMAEFNRVNNIIEPQNKLIETLSEKYKEKELERKETMVGAIKDVSNERKISIEKELELQIDNKSPKSIVPNDTLKIGDLNINITLNFNINEANFNIKDLLKDSINSTLKQVLNR